MSKGWGRLLFEVPARGVPRRVGLQGQYKGEVLAGGCIFRKLSIFLCFDSLSF